MGSPVTRWTAAPEPAAATAFNRMAEREATAAEQAAALPEAFARAGVTFGGEPMRGFLRPHFVERAAWTALREDGRRLLDLAARAARQAFGGDTGRLLDYLGTPAAERPWVEVDPGPPDVVLSRLDAFLTTEGPVFIEINSDAPAGFGYGDASADVLAATPLFRAFASENAVAYEPSAPGLVRAVVTAFHARGGTGSPVVAIVDFAEVKTRPDQELLRQAFAAAGVTAALADPREVALSGGALHAGGRRIDVVYRRAVLQELLEAGPEVATFLEAYRTGAATVVNSFRCRLSEDKAFFALLGDEAHAGLLDPEERAFVDRVVPWTRRLEERHTLRHGTRVDLVPHVIENRAGLVLKPAHGYGGRSVYVGDETDPATWARAVEAARDGAWVVQERVPIPEERFPVLSGRTLAFETLKVNANPFYVTGERVGAVTRASRSSVINVSAGGGSVPTFVAG